MTWLPASLRRLLALRDGAAAYLYGYPLVTMVTAHRELTQPPAATNAFAHTRFLPTGGELGIVRPSRDLLYSSAWLDLSAGPLVLHQPDLGDRFFLMPVLDAWTNVVASPGTRTTGNAAADFLVAGPSWHGEPPAGLTVVRSPTDLAWVVGRIEVAGEADIPAVAALQDGFTLTPLDRWPSGPPNPTAVFDAPEPLGAVRDTVDAMDAAEFFGTLAAVLRSQSPLPGDDRALESLRRIGIEPGQPFDVGAVDGAVRAGIEDAVGRVQRGMTDAVRAGGRSESHGPWRVPPRILGAYGTAYDVRAVVAREGLGANLPEDAVYASASTDSAGDPLRGDRRYVLRFAAGGYPPPLRAFWSVTAYDDRGVLHAAPPGLPSLSSHDRLPVTAGGGLDAYVGAPGPDGQPFLATPPGEVSLVLRLYWPDPEILDGHWEYPSLHRC